MLVFQQLNPIGAKETVKYVIHGIDSSKTVVEMCWKCQLKKASLTTSIYIKWQSTIWRDICLYI